MLLKSAKEFTADVDGVDVSVVSTRNEAGIVSDGLAKVTLLLTELSKDRVDDDASS